MLLVLDTPIFGEPYLRLPGIPELNIFLVLDLGQMNTTNMVLVMTSSDFKPKCVPEIGKNQ